MASCQREKGQIVNQPAEAHASSRRGRLLAAGGGGIAALGGGCGLRGARLVVVVLLVLVLELQLRRLVGRQVDVHDGSLHGGARGM